MLTIDYFLGGRDHRHRPVDRGRRNLFGHHRIHHDHRRGHHRIHRDRHHGHRRIHHDLHRGHHRIHRDRHHGRDHHIGHHRIHHHDLHLPIGLLRHCCYRHDWGQHHPIGFRLLLRDGLEACNGLHHHCHRQNPRLDLKVLQELWTPSPFLDVHVLVASLQARLDVSSLLLQPSYDVLPLDEHVLLRPCAPLLQPCVLPLLEQCASIRRSCVYGHVPICPLPLQSRPCDRLRRMLRRAWPLSTS
mmetsp:Transcript_3481/g.4168  ORF Transcript_3481/g.4168 Transcript_3481/m.4168 type:complete len:244 (-) Transcript_3481:267-998(-)